MIFVIFNISAMLVVAFYKKTYFNPLSFFLLILNIYYTVPYIGYRYMEYADFNEIYVDKYVDDSYFLVFLAIFGVLSGYFLVKFFFVILPKNRRKEMKIVRVIKSNSHWYTFTAAVITFTGFWVTGIVSSIGSYGVNDPAHTSFSALLHFGLIFNILLIFDLYRVSQNELKITRILFYLVPLSIIFLLSGQRSMLAILALMLLFYLRHIHFIKPNLINFIGENIFLYLAYIFVPIIAFLRNYRNDTLSIGARFSDFFDNLSEKAFMSQADLFGSISLSIDKMQHIDYYYGYTFLNGLLSLVPSFVRRSVGIKDEGAFFNYLEFVGDENGAFPLISEFYINLSTYGVIFGFTFIGGVIFLINNTFKNNKLVSMLLTLLSVQFLLEIPRHNSQFILKTFVYSLIISWLYYYLILENTKKERSEKDN